MRNSAFLFPGQGSQSVAMLSELGQAHPVITAVMTRASEILGYDLWELIQMGPQDKLNNTEFTQPAMLASDIAIWQLWCQESPLRPVVVAGHSLGEFAALVAAGAIEFADAIRLVRLRGQLMQSAVKPGVGAMAAVLGLDDADVMALCDQAREDQVLNAANFNSPGQVVVAGHADAVNRLLAIAPQAGAKLAKLIPVSVPSHCSLMQPAVGQFTAAVEAIQSWSLPTIPVIHNAGVCQAESIDHMKQQVVQQLTSPVRWVESVHQMVSMSVDCFYECGPGQVLKGLNKRIIKHVPCQRLGTLGEFELAVNQSKEKL